MASAVEITKRDLKYIKETTIFLRTLIWKIENTMTTEREWYKLASAKSSAHTAHKHLNDLVVCLERVMALRTAAEAIEGDGGKPVPNEALPETW